MSETDKVITLDHTIEICVPSKCGGCDGPLPDQLRREAIEKIKRALGSWFGGYGHIKEYRQTGGYVHHQGRLVEEFDDIIKAKATQEALDQHSDELRRLPVEIADILGQEAVAITVDGAMKLFPGTLSDKERCVHKRTCQK